MSQRTLSLTLSAGGGSAGTVNLTNHSITGLGTVGVAGASASMRLKSDGSAEKVESDVSGGADVTTPFAGEWLVSGLNSEFECMMTTITGTLSSGTAGSWLAMTSDNTWTRSRTLPSGAGTTEYQGTLEIRRVSDLVVVESATIVLTATINP